MCCYILYLERWSKRKGLGVINLMIVLVINKIVKSKSKIKKKSEKKKVKYFYMTYL